MVQSDLSRAPVIPALIDRFAAGVYDRYLGLPRPNTRHLRVLGLVALVISLALTVVPNLGTVVVFAPLIEALVTEETIVLLGIVIVLSGTVSALAELNELSESARTSSDIELPKYSSMSGDETTTTVRTDVDDALATIRESDLAPSDREYVKTKADIRRDLRETTIDLLESVDGVDSSNARHQVDTGQWTDDPRAAAFLGNAVSAPPLRLRVRDWAIGTPLYRTVEATVDAIRELASTDSVLKVPEVRDGGNEASTAAVDSQNEEHSAPNGDVLEAVRALEQRMAEGKNRTQDETGTDETAPKAFELEDEL